MKVYGNAYESGDKVAEENGESSIYWVMQYMWTSTALAEEETTATVRCI